MIGLWISYGLLMIYSQFVHGQNGNNEINSSQVDDGELIFAQTVSVEVIFGVLKHSIYCKKPIM